MQWLVKLECEVKYAIVLDSGYLAYKCESFCQKCELYATETKSPPNSLRLGKAGQLVLIVGQRPPKWQPLREGGVRTGSSVHKALYASCVIPH